MADVTLDTSIAPAPGKPAVSLGKNRIDVFVRGMDDHLGHRWRE